MSQEQGQSLDEVAKAAYQTHQETVLSRADVYRLIGQQIGELVATKNEAYGDSFNIAGDALRLLYPDGIAPDQYGDALAVVRIWDKLKRIATDRDALGETPYRDIAGYGILGAERVERERAKVTAGP